MLQADFSDRLSRLAAQARSAGEDAVVISPGADLTYFAGHSVGSHERLTVLLVPVAGPPLMLVPALERPGWDGSPVERLGIGFTTWTDGQDPYAVLASLLAGSAAPGDPPSTAMRIAVDDHMPAVHALGLRRAVAGSELTLAGPSIAELRMRKEAAEIDALRAAGASIDRVHSRIPEWLRIGRTEREVAADIAAAIIEEGHSRADFVIVGSGPNGASPHHEASDRVIRPGDPVVIDIGGPGVGDRGLPGYFSDCTRTYVMQGELDSDVAQVYEVVRRAQQAGVDAVRPGVPADSVDDAARAVVEAAGYGPQFLTRTGHGIGLEVHEHPYVVTGNTQLLEPGMAFSVEPGVYLAGRFGVRIEDIVVVGDEGPLLMNLTSKALTVIGG